MTDQELADKVVALGGAAKSGNTYALIDCDSDSFGTYALGVASTFVRDWRVAGAMLEHMPHGISLGIDAECVAWCHMHPIREGGYIHDESLPRAIIEACLEARL